MADPWQKQKAKLSKNSCQLVEPVRRGGFVSTKKEQSENQCISGYKKTKKKGPLTSRQTSTEDQSKQN